MTVDTASFRTFTCTDPENFLRRMGVLHSFAIAKTIRQSMVIAKPCCMTSRGPTPCPPVRIRALFSYEHYVNVPIQYNTVYMAVKIDMVQTKTQVAQTATFAHLKASHQNILNSAQVKDAQGQLTPKSAAEFCPNSNSSVLVTCKNEDDPIKN